MFKRLILLTVLKLHPILLLPNFFNEESARIKWFDCSDSERLSSIVRHEQRDICLLHRLHYVQLGQFSWRLKTVFVSSERRVFIFLSVMLVLFVQGLFRIAAGASKLKKLKAALDCSTSQLEEFYSDPHAVAGTSFLLSPELASAS